MRANFRAAKGRKSSDVPGGYVMSRNEILSQEEKFAWVSTFPAGWTKICDKRNFVA